MNSKTFEFGRLHVFVGFSRRVGIEVVFDFQERGLPALDLRILNCYLVLEWWPND
jgi:hypothetical protein